MTPSNNACRNTCDSRRSFSHSQRQPISYIFFSSSQLLIKINSARHFLRVSSQNPFHLNHLKMMKYHLVCSLAKYVFCVATKPSFNYYYYNHNLVKRNEKKVKIYWSLWRPNLASAMYRYIFDFLSCSIGNWRTEMVAHSMMGRIQV